MSGAGLLLAAALAAGAAEHPLPPAPAPSTGTVNLDFVADHLDYGRSSSTIHLKGHVVVRDSTVTLRSDELWIDTRDRTGRSEGFLLVEDSTTAVAGRSGSFDFEKRTAVLRGVSAAYGDWRVHGGKVVLSPGRRIDYSGADFTSCSYDPKPHYHFHASRLNVIPKDRLIAWNTLFYLGPVPILYTPFLYKSLSPTHFIRLRLQPGYDKRNGVFVKSTLLTELTPHLYSKLFLDYYGRQGLGEGGELHRRKGEDSRGALYAYHIQESQGSGRDRWALLGDGYQALASSLAVQGRLQLQSDPDFNNDYSRSSLLRVTPDLTNNAALVWRRPLWTLRGSYSRFDTATSDRRDFVLSRESAPRLEAQSAPLKIWRLPWLNNLNAFADNVSEQGKPFLEKSVGAGWEGTRTFGLARGLSLAPRLAYKQTYYNRFDSPADFMSTATVRDAFVGRYTLQGTLRYATFAGDWDLTEAFTRRQRPDSLAPDVGAPDHGVEQNLATLTDAFRPTRAVLVRASSGWDFRTFRDRTLGFHDRLQPLTADVVLTPRAAWSLALRDDYQLGVGNRQFSGTALWGDELGTHLGGGAGYNIADADTYLFSAQLGYAPSSSSATWRASAGLRAEASSPGGIDRLHAFHLFEKEFLLVKNWHDFYTRLLLRFRPGGVAEVNVRLDLRFGAVRDAYPKKDWESEWFPERRNGAIDRP